MASPSPVRSLDPADYQWKKVRELPTTVWRRPPLANEAMWLARPKEDRDLFVFAFLEFNILKNADVLETAVKSAWKKLRFENPELVLTSGTSTEDGKPYLQYETPQTEEDVDTWIARTSHFESHESNSQGFFAMCDTIINLSGRRDNAFVFARVWRDRSKEDSNTSQKKVGISMKITAYFDHLITDGVGARIMLGRYLSNLAFSISTSLPPKLDWQKSEGQLSPPWISLLDCSQQLSGTHYNRGVLRNRSILTDRMKNNHGIRLLQAEGPVKSKTSFLIFKKPETDALLQEIKKLVAPQPDESKNKEECIDSDSDVDDNLNLHTTITHLGHAAMVLAVLRSNPLPVSTTRGQPIPLYSPCWFNGRKYLIAAQDQASRQRLPTLPLRLNFEATAGTQPSVLSAYFDPRSNYIPICLSFAPIKFPDLRELSVPSNAEGEEIKSSLLKAIWIARKQYAKIGKRKNMLPTCVESFEDLAKQLRYGMHPKDSFKAISCIVVILRGLTIGREQFESKQSITPDSERELTFTGLTYAQAAMQGATPKSNLKQGTSSMADGKHDTSLENEGSISSGLSISPTSENPVISEIPVKMKEPFFLSDGIVERYIEHRYWIKSLIPQDKTPIVSFEVRGVKFTARADCNLIVRMSSWRGTISLQAEWRAGDYDDDTVNKFLEDIKKIMLSILK